MRQPAVTIRADDARGADRPAGVDEAAPLRLPDPWPECDPGAGDRAVARYQRALRLAQEFDAFAEDGSDVTPW